MDDMNDRIALIYIGNADGHGYHIHGVPACDLTQAQIDASGYTVEQLLDFKGPVYALPKSAGLPQRDMLAADEKESE